ncbi:hypothetical protein WKK05_05175 [Nostoc sp. UHCC 0302]
MSVSEGEWRTQFKVSRAQQNKLKKQYGSDETKTLVETAIYRVSKTQNFV